MKKGKYFLKINIVLAGLVLAGLIFYRWHLNTHGHPQTSAAEGEGFGFVNKFKFSDQNNETINNEKLKGHVWISNFIFTRCAGPCPILSTKMARLHEEFSSKKNLKFISFSVDPDYDTPDVLSHYAKKYNADERRWHFLTGSRKKIYNLIQTSFHLAVKKEGHARHDSTDILHSLHFVLVDQAGEIKGYYNSNDVLALQDLEEQIRLLLNK